MAGAWSSSALTAFSDLRLVKGTTLYRKCTCESKQVQNWRAADGNNKDIRFSINNGLKFGRWAASGFAIECSKTSRIALGLSENAVWREWGSAHMENGEQNCSSRSRPAIAACSLGEDNGRRNPETSGGDERKNNGHIYLNSSREENQKSGGLLGPGRQWENIFPAYMQSKSDFIVEDIGSPVRARYENGGTRKSANGVDGAKAAAAAAASAKELESHVKSSAMSSVSPSVSAPPCSSAKPPTEGGKNLWELMSDDPIWAAMRAEARLEAEKEPLLSSYLYASILAHSCFERALGFVLANRLQNPTLLATQLMDVFDDVFMNDDDVRQSIRLDVQAVKDRDPSCRSYSWALLYLKGYHALQSYRVAHALWNRGQRVLALALQSRISEVFAVDIHPAACIGKGILLDHGTGVVIGETAVVGDGVSMLQGVTLGGTGKEVGDRHPKIGGGVLIGAGATILGNITVGKGAMVAAGSLVLKDIPPHSMVAGNPAKVIGFLEEQNPALTMKHDATKGFCQLVAEDSLRGGAGI